MRIQTESVTLSTLPESVRAITGRGTHQVLLPSIAPPLLTLLAALPPATNHAARQPVPYAHLHAGGSSDGGRPGGQHDHDAVTTSEPQQSVYALRSRSSHMAHAFLLHVHVIIVGQKTQWLCQLLRVPCHMNILQQLG